MHVLGTPAGNWRKALEDALASHKLDPTNVKVDARPCTKAPRRAPPACAIALALCTLPHAWRSCRTCEQQIRAWPKQVLRLMPRLWEPLHTCLGLSQGAATTVVPVSALWATLPPAHPCGHTPYLHLYSRLAEAGPSAHTSTTSDRSSSSLQAPFRGAKAALKLGLWQQCEELCGAGRAADPASKEFDAMEKVGGAVCLCQSLSLRYSESVGVVVALGTCGAAGASAGHPQGASLLKCSSVEARARTHRR